MSEEHPDSPHSGHSWSWWILWLLFLLLIVYPLSTGPAALLVSKGVLPMSALKVYKPLEELYNGSPVAQHAFDWYFELWGVN